MTKKSVIIVSIFCGLIALMGVLFGAVFCLRNQEVKVVGDTPIAVSREEIIHAGGLENGQSIFMINKDKTINNIEAKFAYLKVIQIKTTDLMTIQIRVRARHEMFYVHENEKFYVLDEELKVLDILEATTTEPTHLTKIGSGELDISSATMKCDFVGTQQQRQTTYDLYVAMTTVVTKNNGANEVYFTRQDMRDTLLHLDFENLDTYNKIVIDTKFGVNLDIEKPQQDLQTKINICFSTIEQFILDENDKENSGTIKIYYNDIGEMKTVYIPETN